MNQRDEELLDKQLWGVSPTASRNGGKIGVIFIAGFLVGIAIGDIRFGHQSKRTQPVSYDVTAALSLPNLGRPTKAVSFVISNGRRNVRYWHKRTSQTMHVRFRG